ncbi:MAG: YrhK family protein [Pseudomonadales bacterium]
MRLFDPDNHTRSEAHRKIHAAYAVAYTTVDFIAALLFIVGSILFFRSETTYAATWLFLIGSIFFAMRPTISLLRELAYLRAGDYQEVTQQ